MKRVLQGEIACVLILFFAVACGGSPSTGVEPIGQSKGAVSDDLDVPEDGESAWGDATDDEAGVEGSADGSALSGIGGSLASDGPPVTFTLVNSADEELVFSLDKGWQPVIIAFSGKPPNARSILMFPTHCTAACSAAAADRCPYCPEPEHVKDIRAAETRQVIAPGESFEVPWDGQIHVYEKTTGKQNGRSTSCECFKREAVPAETYTVRACGLRLTKSAKSSTKIQCVDSTMTLPSDTPQVVTLDFPAP